MIDYTDILSAEQYDINIDEAKLHRITEMNPMMEETQFNALVDDIREKGQLIPVLVYRGKIVDGRHRLMALRELGEQTIRAINLPNNYSIQEVIDVVESMEKRRHQDKTSMAIKGWRIWKKEGANRIEAAKTAGVAPSMLSYVEQIHKLSGETVINALWEGAYYITMNNSRTRSLAAIVNDLQKRKPPIDVSPEEDEERHPAYKSIMKQFNESPVSIQQAIYEAIRAKMIGE